MAGRGGSHAQAAVSTSLGVRVPQVGLLLSQATSLPSPSSRPTTFYLKCQLCPRLSAWDTLSSPPFTTNTVPSLLGLCPLRATMVLSSVSSSCAPALEAFPPVNTPPG